MLQSVITIISYCLCSSHVLCKHKTIITLTFLCPALVILPGYIFLLFSYTEMHAHTLTPTHPHIEILTLSLLSWHSRSAAAIHQIRVSAVCSPTYCIATPQYGDRKHLFNLSKWDILEGECHLSCECPLLAHGLPVTYIDKAVLCRWWTGHYASDLLRQT